MKDTQNVTIGFLLVTAAILAALLIGAYTTTDAYADTAGKGAGYLMVAGQVSSTSDFIYVIDVQSAKLNTYGYDRARKAILMGVPVDLNQLFGE